MKRMIRIAAAAVAVLAMTVTVYAAVQKYLTVETPEDKWYDLRVRIDEAAGEMISLPAEKMEELQQYAMTQEDMQNGVRKGLVFASWQEAADWLDCGMLVSDRITAADNEWGQISMEVRAQTTEEGEKEILFVNVGGSFHLRDRNEGGYLSVTIPLSGDWDMYGSVVTYGGTYVNEDGVLMHDTGKASDNSAEVTEYTTSSGIPAVIVDVTHLTPGPIYENGVFQKHGEVETVSTSMYFFHEGVVYEWLFENGSDESAADLAKEVADSMK